MSGGLFTKIQTLLNIEKLPLEAIERASPKTDPTVDNTAWQASVIKVAEDFVRIASRATSSRAFFMSDEGYMGIGPRNVRKGDVVCLFPGCRVPLLIRSEPHVEVERLKDSGEETRVDGPAQSIRHYVVGEYFVWGLMDHGTHLRRGLEEFTFW